MLIMQNTSILYACPILKYLLWDKTNTKVIKTPSEDGRGASVNSKFKYLVIIKAYNVASVIGSQLILCLSA